MTMHAIVGFVGVWRIEGRVRILGPDIRSLGGFGYGTWRGLKGM